MAISYKPNNITYVVRSTSLPTTSHPSTHTIEKELNKIKTWVLSSSSCKQSTESICNGLLTLSRLYECLHDSIKFLSSIRNEKWVEEILERLVGFLDVCGIMKDILSQIKEHVRDLHCALRRRKGDSSVESSISSYNCFRKRVKKDVKRLISSLNKSTVAKSSGDHSEVIFNMIMEVTISIFESLLMNFVMGYSQTRKTNKWSLVISKLTPRTRVGCDEHHFQKTNDFEGLHDKLLNRFTRKEFSSWSSAICRLETIEAEIERLENSLDCIFRRMIKTRACLLNIVSNY